jgi:hypothetical protein
MTACGGGGVDENETYQGPMKIDVPEDLRDADFVGSDLPGLSVRTTPDISGREQRLSKGTNLAWARALLVDFLCSKGITSATLYFRRKDGSFGKIVIQLNCGASPETDSSAPVVQSHTLPEIVNQGESYSVVVTCDDSLKVWSYPFRVMRDDWSEIVTVPGAVSVAQDGTKQASFTLTWPQFAGYWGWLVMIIGMQVPNTSGTTPSDWITTRISTISA